MYRGLHCWRSYDGRFSVNSSAARESFRRDSQPGFSRGFQSSLATRVSGRSGSGGDSFDAVDAGDGRLGTASQTVAETDRLTDAASQEVYPELSLNRDDNTAIPGTGFWELASFLSMQADGHANAGTQRYLAESCQTTPLGDNSCAQLQSAAENLVCEARTEGHLEYKMLVAMDTTTGPRF